MSDGTSVIKEIRPKNLVPRVPPFNVTRGYRNRKESIRHLPLTFHNNYHEHILYRLRDKRRFWFKKSQNLPIPVYLTPRLKGFPLKLGVCAWGQKTRMMGLPGYDRSFMMSSAVWIQYINMTDERTGRQTDGQTPCDSKDRADHVTR